MFFSYGYPRQHCTSGPDPGQIRQHPATCGLILSDVGHVWARFGIIWPFQIILRGKFHPKKGGCGPDVAQIWQNVAKFTKVTHLVHVRPRSGPNLAYDTSLTKSGPRLAIVVWAESGPDLHYTHLAHVWQLSPGPDLARTSIIHIRPKSGKSRLGQIWAGPPLYTSGPSLAKVVWAGSGPDLK